LLTYQTEHEESDVVDGRRTPSSKLSDKKDNASVDNEPEESEEEKRDEKV
jgi:hypothetical protein